MTVLSITPRRYTPSLAPTSPAPCAASPFRLVRADLAAHLRKLEPAVAVLLDRIAALPDKLSVYLGPEMASAHMTFRAAHPMPRQVLAVPIRSAFGELAVEIDPACLDGFSDLLLPGWRAESEAALPRDWRAVIVVSHFLAAAALPGAPPAIGAAHPASFMPMPDNATETARGTIYGPDGLAWGFRLHLRSVRADAPMSLSWPVADRVDELLTLTPDTTFLATGPFLAADTIAGLRPGDALLLPASPDHGLIARLAIPDLGTFEGSLSTGGMFTLDTERTMSADNDDDDHDNGTYFSQDTDSPADLHEVIGALRLKVDLILPAPRLTLAEIGRLGPGASIDLAGEIDGPVRIVAGGQTLGSGRLVQIGERIAVQIDRWVGCGEPPHAG